MNDVEVHNIMLRLTEMEAELRVTKHEVKNLHMENISLAGKVEKFEDRMGKKIEDLGEKLGDKINNINMQQQRGLGFFAGAAFIVTSGIAAIVAMAKLLFGG